MTRRAIVNVATGRYVLGQARLKRILADVDRSGATFLSRDSMPVGCPPHQEKPYAFKAAALEDAMRGGYSTLLWCDACIVPTGTITPLFERIERDGYWIANNGFWNHEWTTDSAYADLFAPEISAGMKPDAVHKLNGSIRHVVATAFGLSSAHPIGRSILREYIRLGLSTRAFCGPWKGGRGVQHRHDQTALSVLAWRHGCKITNSPEIFSYAGGETADTLLIADGAY